MRAGLEELYARLETVEAYQIPRVISQNTAQSVTYDKLQAQVLLLSNEVKRPGAQKGQLANQLKSPTTGPKTDSALLDKVNSSSFFRNNCGEARLRSHGVNGGDLQHCCCLRLLSMRDRLDGVELRVDVFRNEATAEAEGNKRTVMSASSSEPGAERTRLKKPFNPSIINYKMHVSGEAHPW